MVWQHRMTPRTRRAGSSRAQEKENPPLEAEEEAEGGLAGARTAGDGEVILLEVGREIDELAEAQADAEVAGGEVVLDAEVVVIGGAVLKGKALAAAGGGFEADGAAAGPEVGLDAEEVVGVWAT